MGKFTKTNGKTISELNILKFSHRFYTIVHISKRKLGIISGSVLIY